MQGSEVVVRQLAAADVPGAQAVTSRALADLTERTNSTMYRELPQPTPEQMRKAQVRYTHFIETDPDGVFVATIDGEVAGVSIATVREGIWGLSLLMVDPTWQNRRIGSQLLARALETSTACRGGIILASPDARALHAYAAAGFRLHPTMGAYGRIDRAKLPGVTGVRDGTIDDTDLIDDVDRAVRGAARTLDIPVHFGLAEQLYVTDDVRGRGYVFTRDGAVRLLGATTEDAATRLLWTALATPAEGTRIMIENVTAMQQWAINVVVAARLTISHVLGGFLVRGETGPLVPYLPSGAFL